MGGTPTNNNNSKFTKIPELPTEGGREAYFRKAFKNNVERVPYGTVLDSIQDVVDFLLSYGHYLEAEGFTWQMDNGTLAYNGVPIVSTSGSQQFDTVRSKVEMWFIR